MAGSHGRDGTQYDNVAHEIFLIIQWLMIVGTTEEILIICNGCNDGKRSGYISPNVI